MNRKSANSCLTDIEKYRKIYFKLLLNEINQIKNKNSFIIIREDALLSKGASNETANQDHHLHLCDTDKENTSLLLNSNISLLFPPNTFMVITFAGALQQASAYCVHLNAELFICADSPRCCCGTLNTVEPLLTVNAWSRVVSTSAAFFSSLIDGCLKYKNKEKPKTGPRPGPRLNYDVKIGPKPGPRGVKKSGVGRNAGL